MYKIIVVLILIFILNFFINKNFETFKNIDNEDYFKNKIILITGSTRGIGLSLAKKLSRYNCKLIINGRNEDRVEQIVNTLKKNGNYISGIAADLSEQENINKLFDKIIDKYGRIDILVNNVIGRYGHKKLSEKKIEDWKKEIDLNVNSIFYISQKVISHMKSKSLHCKIINISSNLSKQNFERFHGKFLCFRKQLGTGLPIRLVTHLAVLPCEFGPAAVAREGRVHLVRVH